MIGKTISHYKILEELGRGGMGVVYKAHDTKLHRDVALKFLPADVESDDERRGRFLIEARAAAALNHSHIATIHAIEEVDDRTFIVMECIEGEELKQKILGNMSQRATQMLTEEMEYLGPVRLSEVESVQQQIVDIIRRLEDAGQISTHVDEQDEEMIQ